MSELLGALLVSVVLTTLLCLPMLIAGWHDDRQSIGGRLSDGRIKRLACRGPRPDARRVEATP